MIDMNTFDEWIRETIRRLAAGPRDRDAPFVLGRAGYGEVYAMAAQILHDCPEQGSDACLCLCTEDRASIAAAILAALCGGPSVVVPHALSPQAVDELRRSLPFTRALAEPDRELPPGLERIVPGGDRPWRGCARPAQSDTVVLRLFTGGSTGRPRIWSKTAGNLIGEAAYQARAFSVTPADRVLATAPPYHIYGLLFSVLVPFVAGAATVAETPVFPGEIIDATRRHRPTMFVSVPVHYRVLCRADLDAGVYRIAFSSAGPLERDDGLAFHAKTGTGVVEIYGSTETGGVATRARANGEEHLTPLDVVAWRVDDGLLAVKSPFISPELPRDGAGYYLTGDRITANGDGSFSLMGRADGIVKVGGKRVDLQEVRDRLVALPGVRDAFVYMDDRGGRRERILAVVEGDDEGQAYRAALVGLLEPQALPGRIRSVGRMPMTPAGKYDREAIQRLFNTAGEEERS